LPNFDFLYSSKIIFAFYLSLIIIVLLEMSITRLTYINLNQFLTLDNKLLLFSIFGLVSFVGQFLLLLYIKNKTLEEKVKFGISRTFNVVFYSQFLFIVIFFILFVEMELYNRYHTILLIVQTALSFILVSFIMASFGRILLQWYKIEGNILLLLYWVSFATITINIITSAFATIIFLFDKSDITYTYVGFSMTSSNSSVIGVLNAISYISSLCGFVLAWISTFMMLRQYSIRWRNKFHWLIVSLPLIYFFIQYNPFILNQILSLMKLSIVPYSILYTLFITYGGLAGGIIFGAAFWTLTKLLKQKSLIFEFPRIAGYGFLLLLVTNHIIYLASANFPPFGIIATSLLPLACILLFVGIYASAVTVSLDNKIKYSIKNLVVSKSNLLLSMSASEAVVFLEKQVSKIYNNVSKEAPEIGTNTSLTFEEAKNYLISELHDIRISMEEQAKNKSKE
jgi:hypothetical protein